jgi:hypothetical protein
MRQALFTSVPVTGLLEAAYYFGGITGTPDETPLRAALAATAGAAIAALLVWPVLRHRDPARLAGWLGLAAVVSFLGFWIGSFGPVCAAAGVAGMGAPAGPAWPAARWWPRRARCCWCSEPRDGLRLRRARPLRRPAARPALRGAVRRTGGRRAGRARALRARLPLAR